MAELLAAGELVQPLRRVVVMRKEDNAQKRGGSVLPQSFGGNELLSPQVGNGAVGVWAITLTSSGSDGHTDSAPLCKDRIGSDLGIPRGRIRRLP